MGGPAGQGKFLNGGVLLETSLSPRRLMEAMQGTEAEFGRDRGQRWGPRPLDLDLLLYDSQVLETPQLVVPHPRMAWRRFVLEPAAEIAGSMLHPTLGWSVARLWEHLNTAAPYLAIAGPPAAGKTELARQIGRKIVARLHCRPLGEPRLARCSRALVAGRISYPRPAGGRVGRPADGVGGSVRWSVSDFWWPQSLAYAGVCLPAQQQAAFRGHWEGRTRTVVVPKLTVLVDPPAERPSPWEQVRRAVAAQAGQPGQGPVLRLSGPAFLDALAEVLTAIESMG